MAIRFIGTLSLSQNVNKWLKSTSLPRILHAFNNACNLINEYGEILSIVTPQIGNGPFNLVVEDGVVSFRYLNAESSVLIADAHLQIGDWAIKTDDAALWNPLPDWERPYSKRSDIANQLSAWQGATEIASSHPPILQSSDSLSNALVREDLPTAISAAKQLAGLGIGLTPSGDDFIMGALYASWIIHPKEVASNLGHAVAAASAPLTTSLSAAWLRSAGRGEAGIRWHELFEALVSGESSAIQLQITNILSIGATSGADALAGFIKTLITYAEPKKNHVVPEILQR